ncbi:MAG: helix-turn-helix domain-containing protein [Nitrospiria bacterium]
MSPGILLIHKDSEIVSDFQDVVKGNGAKLTPLHADKALSREVVSPDNLVVITAENNTEQVLHILEQFQKSEEPFYAIVSTTEMLKKTVHQIHETSIKLNPDPNSGGTNRRQQNNPDRRREDRRKRERANFGELIEKRLSDFIGKVRSHEGENLFDLLMQEVEKPLLKMALCETRGNQVQAAQLLGMHRNTLRKKMKNLDISYKKPLP